MSTKSARSSGTQFTQRGVNQGNVLVGPGSGKPIDEIVDGAGIRRLAVDANLTADNIDVDIRNLDCETDNIAICDPDNENTLNINSDGSIDANVEVDAADGDNIAIKDSDGNELEINPDGSIDVNVINTTTAVANLKTFYNEVTSVASSTLTTVQTYTVPSGITTYIQKAEVSGTNIAEFTLEINSTVQDKKRTYFGNSLNEKFIFTESSNGLKVNVGDIITVKVVHLRPMVGDFNSRLQIVEI